VADGKKVLFVSEKLAALQVVKRRLDQCGLGDACLELHGYQADKKSVLSELERTMYAASPAAAQSSESKLAALVDARKALNRYVAELHARRFATHLSAFDVYGLLGELRGAPIVQYVPSGVSDTDQTELDRRRACLNLLLTHAPIIDDLAHHPWRGLRSRPPSPAFQSELRKHLTDLQALAGQFERALSEACAQTGLSLDEDLSHTAEVRAFFARYKATILGLPAGEYYRRFTGPYASGARLLRPGYWRDSRAIAAHRREGKADYRTVVKDLATLQSIQARLFPAGAIAPEDDKLAPLVAQLGELGVQAEAELGYFASLFDDGVFTGQDLEQHFCRAGAWCAERLTAMTAADDYLLYAHDREGAIEAGLGDFMEAAIAARVRVACWPAAYLRGFYEMWFEAALLQAPNLAYFKREAHEQIIARFRELDREQFRLAARAVAERAASVRPRPNVLAQYASTAEISVLLREFKKQRRIKPLRRLFREAPNVVQALKPVFMMSPLSVSQFIEPINIPTGPLPSSPSARPRRRRSGASSSAACRNGLTCSPFSTRSAMSASTSRTSS